MSAIALTFLGIGIAKAKIGDKGYAVPVGLVLFERRLFPWVDALIKAEKTSEEQYGRKLGRTSLLSPELYEFCITHIF
ncbi:hypothetical protein V6N12_066573 [Hibiscus sabdariffa]|uniref:Uncharacterized protein n=1 Tax=Hibiscus sabdariffa TaxID=183260 RepID=A0ABR2CSW3_9ROSI